MDNIPRIAQHSFTKSWLLASVILLFAIVVSAIIIAFPRSQSVHALPATPTLQVFPPNGQIYFSNTRLRVNGSHYPIGETATVYWDYKDAGNPGTAEGSATVASDGTFSVSFALPLAPTATYTIAGITSISGIQDAFATTSFQILPNLSALPRATGAGSSFTLKGLAFGARETVSIYWNCTSSCTGTPLATASTDANGLFQTQATIPSSNVNYGKNSLLGIGQTSNASATAKIIVYRPMLALAPLSGSASTKLTITAYGFRKSENVSGYWNNSTTPFFSLQTNPNGYVPNQLFSVPAGTPTGSYPVKIVGATSHLTISNNFTVVAPNASLNFSSGPVGAKVRVSGQGYAPHETIKVFWNYSGSGTGSKVAVAVAGISGVFHVGFIVPHTATGTYAVAAIGTTSGAITQQNFGVTTGLAVTPTTLAPGQNTTVTAAGFQANETVKLYLDTASGTPLLTTTAGADGSVNHALALPASATPGSHQIVGIGKTSGITFSTSITIDTLWNDFGFGSDHLRNNPFENTVSAANVAKLQAKWMASPDLGSPQPEGAPSPIYYQGMVYIATFDGYLRAYNATTGVEQWHYFTNTSFANLSSPVIDPATNILFFGTLGFLEEQDHGIPSPSFALDAQSGRLLWSQIIAGDDYAFPTIASNTIYVGVANEGGGFLLALDETTGYLNWQYQTNGGTWGAVGLDIKTNTLFTGVGNPGDQVLSLNATTGALNWQQTIVSPGADDDIGTAMAVTNGMVYVDSKNGNMYALDEKTGAIVWQTKIGASSQGNVSAPAVSASGVLYVGSLNGNLYALNATTGALLWKRSLEGQIFSSPALANGVVYVASNEGNLYALDASSGGILWSNSLGGVPTFSSPIIANGWLYCASTSGNLYAFSL